MKKDDCIFCKLANGDIPTNMIYQDDDFAVIMDAAPVSKGHALILPREHADNLYELPDETASKLMPLAKKIASRMKERLNCDGLNILQNNGETAGQSVFHFHMHVIPRYDGAANNSDLLKFSSANLSEGEISDISSQLS